MKCGHCFFDFEMEHDKEIYGYSDDEIHAFISNYECPRCNRPNLFYCAFKYEDHGGDIIPFWPATDRPPCPPEVPSHIAEDYREACLVLRISPKASAALSRRCLQNLLRGAAKVKPSDLSVEIQDVINSGQLPSHIEESIHAIRQIGNFAAHPLKSKSTGEVLPVERGEAEWNLDTLVDLFDFYYVKPKQTAQKLADLNAKLQDVERHSRK